MKQNSCYPLHHIALVPHKLCKLFFHCAVLCVCVCCVMCMCAIIYVCMCATNHTSRNNRGFLECLKSVAKKPLCSGLLWKYVFWHGFSAEVALMPLRLSSWHQHLVQPMTLVWWNWRWENIRSAYSPLQNLTRSVDFYLFYSRNMTKGRNLWFSRGRTAGACYGKHNLLLDFSLLGFFIWQFRHTSGHLEPNHMKMISHCQLFLWAASHADLPGKPFFLLRICKQKKPGWAAVWIVETAFRALSHENRAMQRSLHAIMQEGLQSSVHFWRSPGRDLFICNIFYRPYIHNNITKDIFRGSGI